MMGVRNVAQGKALKSELLQMRSNMPIHVIELQLGEYSNVTAFCNQVNPITKSVTVVIVNGGTSGYNYKVSKSGHENIMQVNVYSNIHSSRGQLSYGDNHLA
ncbi:hypothetical protein FGRMN_1381 [Fusarium graminum]|nr:hypothetical protein FGRMN_1381 [Fusarium graminum]